MLKNEKCANRNDHQNRKTEVFCNKNRKTDLKNSQNRKTENPNAPLYNKCRNINLEKPFCVCHGSWGPFLESPGNFTGPKSNIQIEI